MQSNKLMKTKICFLAVVLSFFAPKLCVADSFSEGINFFNKADYIKAEKYFNNAVLINPNNKTIRYYYATALFNNKKFNKAKSEYFYIVANYSKSEEAKKSIEFLNYLYNLDEYKRSITRVEVDIVDNHNIMIINGILINGIHNCNFILDTGASYTVISRSVARRLGLHTKNAPKVKITTANGTVEVPKIKLKSIEIGGMEIKNVDAVIQDIDNHRNVVGLLGLSFLNHFNVIINKKAGKLILEKH